MKTTTTKTPPWDEIHLHPGMKTTAAAAAAAAPPSLLSLSSFFLLFFFFVASAASSSSSSALRGLHPLDAKYFDSEVIKCKDGSSSFTRDRFNDDFCDCIDGTDEPGTSACPNGKFYCRNQGSTPLFLFSSRVNDHICDCCDGSDEYDGIMDCPNTCIMGGGIEYKRAEYRHVISSPAVIQARERKPRGKLDLIQSFKDLKALALIQLIAILCILALWFFYHRIKSRRQRYR